VKRLAVILLNWNGLADTLAALDSLRACRTPEGWTLWTIVVDNGSTDGSPEALAARADAELIALPHNVRFAAGNNAGLERALAGGAQAIALLNNDTEADAGLFERLLLALEQDPAAGAVGPLIYHAPPTDRIWYAAASAGPGWRGPPTMASASATTASIARSSAPATSRGAACWRGERCGSAWGRSTSVTTSMPRTATGVCGRAPRATGCCSSPPRDCGTRCRRAAGRRAHGRSITACERI